MHKYHHVSTLVQIGINCFTDIEIRSIIASGGKIGTCDITKEQNISVYDTKDLSQNTDLSAYFCEILDVYTPESELPSDFPKDCLNSIENILMTDWSIFDLPNDKIKLALQEICKDTYPNDSLLFTEKVGVEKLCDHDFLKNNCLMKESTWERFMSSIKGINRFHSNHINLDLLTELFNSPSMQITITKNEKYFYRGRICSEQGLEKQKMGPPPLEFATAGPSETLSLNKIENRAGEGAQWSRSAPSSIPHTQKTKSILAIRVQRTGHLLSRRPADGRDLS